jgi:hypothetical protein
MKAPLTPEDKKSLRYECRPGISIAVGLYFLFFIIVFISFDFKGKEGTLKEYLILFAILTSLFMVCLLLAFIYSRKYITDIKNDEKDLKRYPIQKKESKVDYEAGSGRLKFGGEMKAFDHYLLTIDDCVHDVDKEMFDRASVGDEVIMHTAPISGHLLKIELVR